MSFLQEMSSTSVIMVGHFNPLIFRPEWFVKNKLITNADFKEVEIGVIHPDIVAFAIKPWLKIHVDSNRFAAEILQEPSIRLFDLVVSCFMRLPESPVAKLGINRGINVNLETEEKWHLLGDMLAPKEPWGDFLSEAANGKRKGGLLSLTMQEQRVDENFPGQCNVKIEPSVQFRYGAHFHINDHYDLDSDTIKNAKDAIQTIEKHWNESFDKFETLVTFILDQVK